jgi:calcineurin-like phosphoesterase family protein
MSASAPAKAAPNRRSLKDLRRLPRSPALSKYRAALERVGQTPSKFPSLSYFSPAAWWNWFRTYAPHAFARNCRFRTDTGPYQSKYPLRNGSGGQPARISMAGDWGTGTNEAEAVTGSMTPDDALPDYTIHLGDVYFIGDGPSIDENCLGTPNPSPNSFAPVKWRPGRLGSFAMNGNHEMYATGEPYFSKFLPTLGCIENGKAMGQGVSYFCIENDYWRVIGLDTGYHSRGLPFLSLLGSALPFLRPSCRLPDPVLDWLRTVVKIQDDRQRGLILLTHHQYYSAFEENYTKAAKQLAALIDRPVLWFWGHEHRMAGYHLQGPAKILAHGRCIGHGGMPVERHDPPDCNKVVFFDNRVYSAQDNFGWNGYVNLDFEDAHLTVRYFDIGSIQGGQNRLLIEEKWTVDAQGQLSVQIGQQCMEEDFYGPAKWG